MKKILLTVALGCAAWAMPATAAVELDQDAAIVLAAGQSFGGAPIASGGSSAPNQAHIESYLSLQTFTAGKTGQLTQIDLQDFAQNFTDGTTTFTLSLFQGNGTVSGNSALGSVNFSTMQSYADYLAGKLYAVDVSSLGFNVAAGSTYSFMLSAAPTDDRAIILDGAVAAVDEAGNITLNDYAGGRNYHYYLSDPVHAVGWEFGQDFSTDRGFRTFVDVAPVPEPGEWAMIAGGLGIVGAAARRRAKRAA